MVSLDELNASVYKDHILTTTLSLWGQWSILILNTMLVYGIRTIEIKTKLFILQTFALACFWSSGVNYPHLL